jgi:hypothetical protein
MTRVLAATTVLLVHTAAAWAQQAPGAGPFGPPAEGPGTPPAAAPPPAPEAPPTFGPPAPPAPPAPASPSPASPSPPSPAQPAPAQPVQPVPAPEGGYPPGYGPPPGYIAPPGYGPPQDAGAPGDGATYGAPAYPPSGYPPAGYGAPPRYGAPYGYSRYRHAPPPPPRRVTDRPFTIGGGIGFGGLELRDSVGGTWRQPGLSYSARLGLGLRPGLLLLWDIEGTTVEQSTAAGLGARSHTLSQTAQLAALQVFVGDHFFIKGGFGFAQLNQDDAIYTNWGGAVMGGLGLELVQGWNWSLDVESTVTAAFYQDESMLNWSLATFALNLF